MKSFLLFFSFIVFQVAQGATSLSSTSAIVAPAAGGGSFSLTVSPDAAWTASTTASWLAVSPTSGSTSAVITYTWTANTAAVSRQARVDIAGKSFSVFQVGTGGVYSLWGSSGPGTITTIAGGSSGATGDGGQATAAQLSRPEGMAVDGNGNLYIADTSGNRVRRVDAATGVITTIAGTGAAGFSGDDGPAASATIKFPASVVLNQAGDIYFLDAGNWRIRRVDHSTGVISTVAGSGSSTDSGDGGPATAAGISSPGGMAIDGNGALYVCEGSGNRVRKIDIASGIITTVAGNGTAGLSGDGLPATAANLDGPSAVAVDGSGNLYIADLYNYRIRRVDAVTGLISTVTGTGPESLSSSYSFYPNSLAFDLAGNLYVGDTYNAVFRIDGTTSLVTTIVSGNYGYSGDGGPAVGASLNGLAGLATDAGGSLYISEATNNRIRFVDLATPVVTPPPTIVNLTAAAGSGTAAFTLTPSGSYWSASSIAPWLTVTQPEGAGNGSVAYSYTTNNSAVSRSAAIIIEGKAIQVTQAGAAVTLSASSALAPAGGGSGGFGITVSPSVSWTATSSATWLTVTPPSGSASASLTWTATANTGSNARSAIITAGGKTFSVAQPSGSGVYTPWGGTANSQITTVAGGGGGADNIAATQTSFSSPAGIALDANNNLFIADAGGNKIRRVDALTGIITTIAGTGTQGFDGDGGAGTSALLNGPQGIAVVGQTVYFNDTGNNRIRKIDAGGIITTVGGTSSSPYSGDGGPGTSVVLNSPRGLAADAEGNLYFTETSAPRVRRMDASTGRIITVAGTGISGYGGDGGAATAASFSDPEAVALDKAGNIFIADKGNYRIRRIDAVTGVITTAAGNGSSCCGGGDNGPATSATLSSPGGVTFDSAGNLVISDTQDYRIRRVDSSGTIATITGSGSCCSAGDSQSALLAYISPTGIVGDSSGNLYVIDGTRVRFIDFSTPSITLAAQNVTVGQTGGTGSLSMTLLPSGAFWGAASSASWLTITTPSGSGSGSIGYSVTVNNSVISRTASITIAGKSAIVTQAGARASLASYSATTGAAAGSATVNLSVTANVPWSASSSASWLTVSPTSGSGSATITYNWTANSNATARLAAITAAGQTFSVLQGTATQLFSIRGDATRGTILTVAGNGQSPPYNTVTDGVLATSTTVSGQPGVAVDGNGNLFVVDGNRVRRVDAATGIISTVAGGGTSSQSGDGGAATSAYLYSPQALALDPQGNLFIADPGDQRIRRVDATSGIITTVAGTGSNGSSGNYGGDGGPAIAAQLNGPNDIAVDSNGVLFIADSNNYRIRRVDPVSGLITTIAGSGTSGSTGDGGQAVLAQLSYPRWIAVDAASDVFVLGTQNGAIRKIFGATGLISTVPGGANMNFYQAFGLAADAAGNLFAGNANVLYRVDGATGVLTTLAGNGSSGDGGPATVAALNSPTRVAVDGAGNIYLSEYYRVRYIDQSTPQVAIAPERVSVAASASSGQVTFSVSPANISWTATSSVPWVTIGSPNGTGAAAISYSTTVNNSFGSRIGLITVLGQSFVVQQSGVSASITPAGVTVNAAAGSGNFGLTTQTGVAWTATSSDTWVTPSPLSGSGSAPISYAYTANAGTTARTAAITVAGQTFSITQLPMSLQYSPWGTGGNGLISAIAGSSSSGYSGDGGPAASAALSGPYGLAVSANNILYIADTGNHRVRAIDPATGVINTIAGVGTGGFSGDGGQAASTKLSSPSGVALDTAGDLFIADTGNNRIRRVDATTGLVSTVAGTGTAGYGGDGGPATAATLSRPLAMVVDPAGNIYISDTGNSVIRRVDSSSGAIITIAGTGTSGSSGDNGPASQALLNQPAGLAIDFAGNLLIADSGNDRVRRVDAATGTITTVVGNSNSSSTGDGGPAASASLSAAFAVAIDSASNLYIADAYRIRRVDGTTGIITTTAGTGCCYSSGGDGGPAIVATLYSARAVAVNSSGLYIADDSRIRFIDLASPVVTPAASFLSLGAAAGTGSANVTISPSGAAWAAASTAPWITLTNSGGTGSGSISYTYTANNSTFLRTGTITIYDQRIVVSQAGAATTLSSASTVVSSTAGTFPVSMTLSSQVPWTAASSASWLTPNPSSGDGDATITWTYSANPSINARMATLQIGGKTFSVLQTGTASHYTPWGALGNGIITTVAGNSGSAAALYSAESVAVDANGNLFVGEQSRIVRIDSATGAATTIAGTGSFSISGDGGPATSASLAYALCMAFDAAGNLYFSDSYGAVVRKVDAVTGTISRVAGISYSSTASSGDGGPAVSATLSSPYGIAVDSVRSLLYIGDGNRVRAVDLTTGVISTYAGSATYGFAGDGRPASQAQMSGIGTIALDSAGSLFVYDLGNYRVRRIDAVTKNISTVAGNGCCAFSGDGGLATQASLGGQSNGASIAVDPAGNLYISDNWYSRIRKVDAATGIITTIAGAGGNSSTGDGGPATAAGLQYPSSIATDVSGDVYFLENGSRVRFIDYASPAISLTSTSTSVAAAAGSGSFSFTISAGGAWSASSDSPWLVISPSFGSGNGTISYIFSANATATSRSGIITVGGKSFTVIQAGTSTGGGNGGGGGSGPPAGNPLVATPNSVNLTGAPGGATVTQNLTVTYESFTTMAPAFAVNFSTNQGQGWLGASPASGTMSLSAVTGLQFTYSATITVSCNPAALTAGTYTGTVNVSAAGGILSAPVTFNISSQPTKYMVAPQSLDFRYQQGDATPPAAQNLSVFSVPGGGTFTASASSTGNWLAVSVGGKTPSAVSVTAIVNGLAPGTYSGTISITSAGFVFEAPVSLTIVKADPPALSLSPARESISLAQDSSASSGQVMISNRGGGTLQFTASSDATWLKLVGSSGSAVSGSPVSLGFSADPSGLNAGTYTGHILVNDSAVTVVLTVTKAAAPSIQLSKTGVALTGVVGGSAPQAQTVAVSNGGKGTLNWRLQTSTTSGGSWLSAIESGGSITISANTSGLLPGQYYGSVNVVAADAVNSPQTVSVSLNVMAASASPGVLVSTSGVLLVGTAGGATVSQNVTLFNAAPTAVTYSSVVFAGEWLSVNSASGILNAGTNTIQISGVMSGLAAGVQQGTITLGFSDGSFTAINVAALVLPAGTTASVRGGLRPMASVSTCLGGKASYLIPIFRSPSNGSSVEAAGAVTVQAQVIDDCGDAVTAAGGGSVQVAFSNGDPGINLNDVGGGVWEATWAPANAEPSVVLQVAASANGLSANPSLSALSTLTVSVAVASANAAPAPTGIANAASAGQATPGVVSPGSYIAIYGTGLAGSGNPSATTLPLPMNLNGTQLYLGGLPMPLLYAGAGQVNALVPEGIAPNASYPLVVVRGNAQSVPVALTVTELQPGAYTVDTSGSGAGIVTNAATGALISSSNPAHAGDYLVIYSTGLGSLIGATGETQPGDGAAAPSNVVYYATANVNVTINGVSTPALFAGLTPTFAGLYQVNIQMPNGIAAGSAIPVVITASDPETGATANGNAVTIAVQ